ncbi:hypothetical protein PQR39_26290 [Paraburkholderia sediminicola]|uniref:hypothetical protein n=1 Tax=Paraburkholderia sediminicola TaxID=458836 RepID=UPI0038BE0276
MARAIAPENNIGSSRMVTLRNIAIFAVAFLIVVMLTAFFKWPPMTSSDWAAWVQAIGAIGAIGVAIYVSWAQAKNDRARADERDHAERLRLLEGPMGIIGAAVRAISKAPSPSADEAEVEGIVSNESWWSEFMRAQTALINIPLHTIPWWGISECILEMLTHVDKCRNAMQKLNHEFAQRHNTVPVVWRESLSVLDACVLEALVTWKKANTEADQVVKRHRV